MTFLEEITCEEAYSHESIEDVAEMRPSGDDWYDVLDMRNNRDRATLGLGLSDWQADFPITTHTDGMIVDGFVVA